MKKEPALLVMLLVFILTRLLDVFGFDTTAGGQVDPETLETVAEFILMLGGGALIRWKVFSEHTIRKAGLTPTEVQVRADDPRAPTAKG